MERVHWFYGCPECRFIGGWGREDGHLECLKCGSILMLINDRETDRALVICPGCKEVLYRHSWEDASSPCPVCGHKDMETLAATASEYATYLCARNRFGGAR